MRSLRVLSKLLAYPDDALMVHIDELKAAIVDEGFLKKKACANLFAFMDELQAKELLEAQEAYVELFDRGRAHCLHLFEHVHGESRFRGQAMIDLSERYAEKGLHIGVGELPDYLPLFLEFISISDPKDGMEMLTNAAPIIATIGEKLKRAGSGYASVFAAIVDLSGAKLKTADIQKAADAALPHIQSLDELDKEWEEPPAFGGAPDCGTCGPDGLPTQSGMGA